MLPSRLRIATSGHCRTTTHLNHRVSTPYQLIRMAHNQTFFKLNTGAQISAIGFGTWQDADAQKDAVKIALKAGYHHIDTARVYGTEAGVGKGIRDSGVPREKVFITTKLWNNAHHPDDVEKQLDASLKDLSVDYVDLWLMHWPSAFTHGDGLFPKDDQGKMKTLDIDYVDTYKAMEKCLQKGKTKAIGVSNFSKAEMERLLKETSVVPTVHQIEAHPWLQQNDFLEWHKQKGIHVVAYSPFGNQNEIYDAGKGLSKLMDDPVLVEIGKEHGKTGAQVALAWGITKGHSVIPKSKTESRIKANLEGDFKLSDDEMKKITGIDKKLRLNDPSKSFRYEYFTDLEGKKK